MKNGRYDALLNQAAAINDVVKFSDKQRDDIKCFENVMKKRNVRLYSIMSFASARLATLYYRAEPYLMLSLGDNMIEVDKTIVWDINRWDEQNKDVNTLSMSCRDMLIDVYHISEEYVDGIISEVDEYRLYAAEERLNKVFTAEREGEIRSKSLRKYVIPEHRRLVNRLVLDDPDWGKLAGTMYYLIKSQQSSISSSQLSAESQAKKMRQNGLDPNGCELGLTCSSEIIRRMIEINTVSERLIDNWGDGNFSKTLRAIRSTVETRIKNEL